jgi:hypothetical protein
VTALLVLLERLLTWLGLRGTPIRALAAGARRDQVADVRRSLGEDHVAFGREMARRGERRPVLALGRSGEDDYLLELPAIRGAHVHTQAAPGAGKSRLLAHVMTSVVEQIGQGAPWSVVLVDPKHETAGLLMRSLGQLLLRADARTAERITRNLVAIRPFAGAFVTPIPGIEPIPGVDVLAHARVVLELAERTTGAHLGARQTQAGVFAIATLIANRVNLIEAPFLLRDPARMRALAEAVPEPAIRAYFRSGAFARESQQTLSGLVSRFEAILGISSIKPMFASDEPLDLRRVFEPGSICVVDLGGAPLGAGALVDTVGALLLSRLAFAAFDQSIENRAEGTLFVIDELAQLATPSVIEAVERILVTGRWLGLCLWTAAQYGGQLPALDRLLNANTRIRCFGRTSAREVDGAALDALPVTGRRLKPSRPGEARDGIELMSEAEEIREWTRRIGRLAPRDFVVADRAAPFAPRLVRVPAFEPPAWDALPAQIRETLERGAFGRPRAELLARAREIEQAAADRLFASPAAAAVGQPRGAQTIRLPDIASARRGMRGR